MRVPGSPFIGRKKEVQIYASSSGKNGLNPAEDEAERRRMRSVRWSLSPGDVTQTTPFGKMTRRDVPGKGMVAFIPGMGTLKVSGARWRRRATD